MLLTGSFCAISHDPVIPEQTSHEPVIPEQVSHGPGCFCAGLSWARLFLRRSRMGPVSRILARSS